MRQSKKGNEWHFGMKAHIGVDAGSGMVHSVETTAANVADIAARLYMLFASANLLKWAWSLRPYERRPAGT
jgi:IS5 family transposase